MRFFFSKPEIDVVLLNEGDLYRIWRATYGVAPDYEIEPENPPIQTKHLAYILTESISDLAYVLVTFQATRQLYRISKSRYEVVLITSDDARIEEFNRRFTPNSVPKTLKIEDLDALDRLFGGGVLRLFEVDIGRARAMLGDLVPPVLEDQETQTNYFYTIDSMVLLFGMIEGELRKDEKRVMPCQLIQSNENEMTMRRARTLPIVDRAYVRTSNGLYYVCKSRSECTQIPVNPTQLSEFDVMVNPAGGTRFLSPWELRRIAALRESCGAGVSIYDYELFTADRGRIKCEIREIREICDQVEEAFNKEIPSAVLQNTRAIYQRARRSVVTSISNIRRTCACIETLKWNQLTKKVAIGVLATGGVMVIAGCAAVAIIFTAGLAAPAVVPAAGAATTGLLTAAATTSAATATAASAPVIVPAAAAAIGVASGGTALSASAGAGVLLSGRRIRRAGAKESAGGAGSDAGPEDLGEDYFLIREEFLRWVKNLAGASKIKAIGAVEVKKSAESIAVARVGYSPKAVNPMDLEPLRASADLMGKPAPLQVLTRVEGIKPVTAFQMISIFKLSEKAEGGEPVVESVSRVAVSPRS